MPRAHVPEFRDQFRAAAYPFADGSTLVADDGVFAVPRDLLADAIVLPTGVVPPVRLTAITVAAGQVTWAFGTSAAPAAATGTLDASSPPGTLHLADPIGGYAGTLVFDPDRALDMAVWTAGTYTFAADAAVLVSSSVVVLPDPGVRALAAGDEWFWGDVWLVAEDGVVLGPGSGPNTIRIDVVGDANPDRRRCGVGDATPAPRFITSINGVGPNAYGQVLLGVGTRDSVDPPLQLIPGGAGLTLRMTRPGP